MGWDGLDWTKQTGLPTDDLTAIAMDGSTSPGNLFVGTGEDGVYVSQDEGSTWTPFNEGLGNRSISILALGTNQSKKLYAGTVYGGVWVRTLPSTNFLVYLPLLHKGGP
jgi:hypothetical protein